MRCWCGSRCPGFRARHSASARGCLHRHGLRPESGNCARWAAGGSPTARLRPGVATAASLVPGVRACRETSCRDPLPRDSRLASLPLPVAMARRLAARTFLRDGDTVIAERAQGGKPARFAGVRAATPAMEFQPWRDGAEGGSNRRKRGARVCWRCWGDRRRLFQPDAVLFRLVEARIAMGRREACAGERGFMGGRHCRDGALGAHCLQYAPGDAEAGVPAAGVRDDHVRSCATAIALNLLRAFQLPVGRARPSGGFATGALAAFVATPCQDRSRRGVGTALCCRGGIGAVLRRWSRLHNPFLASASPRLRSGAQQARGWCG